jgi:hypothetical protein
MEPPVDHFVGRGRSRVTPQGRGDASMSGRGTTRGGMRILRSTSFGRGRAMPSLNPEVSAGGQSSISRPTRAIRGRFPGRASAGGAMRGVGRGQFRTTTTTTAAIEGTK